MMLLSSPAVLAPVRAVASRRSRARAVHRTCAAADDSVRAPARARGSLARGLTRGARRQASVKRSTSARGASCRTTRRSTRCVRRWASSGVRRKLREPVATSRGRRKRRPRCHRHCGHVLWRTARATRARHARRRLTAATTQGRDAGGWVGGWAGGEKELKDWAAVPFSPIDPALRKAMNDFSDKKEVSCARRHTMCPSLTARLCAPQADGSEREGIYGALTRAICGMLLACAGRGSSMRCRSVAWRRHGWPALVADATLQLARAAS